MQIILYENNQVEKLYPITLTRASFDIFCGALTLFQAIEKIFPDSAIDYAVRDYLQATVERKYLRKDAGELEMLFLDGSLIPSLEAAQNLRAIIKEGKEAIFKNGERTVGAFILRKASPPEVDPMPEAGIAPSAEKQDEIESYLAGLDLPPKEINWLNFNHPWEVITFNQEILKNNLEILKKDFKEIQPGVFAGREVKIAKEAIFDIAKGPIVIDSQTEISPFVYLQGPLYLGKNCLVKEFTSLKGGCGVGDVCKIGGEVEASIFQSYSNKQHYGFLGHSFIGEWVNLGAGTANSDLKNNYGSVKMAGADTGQQFLGCIIGDYSKTAINTAIFTGKIIGVNSFLYGTIYSDVPSFTNCAGQLGCVVEFNLAEAIKIQKVVMARRNFESGEIDQQLLKDVFVLTKEDRKKSGISPGKLEFKI